MALLTSNRKARGRAQNCGLHGMHGLEITEGVMESQEGMKWIGLALSTCEGQLTIVQ